MKTRSLAPLIEQIRRLSSLELERQTELLAKREHLRGARLIAHLAEVNLRKLHLQLGYRSLFEYCTKRLGLSEGCTALRIQVSRVCVRHPLILDALAGQEISLTVAGMLAPHLTPGNLERLIADCAGMTKRGVGEYLVHLAPKPVVSSGVRRRAAPDRARAPKKPGSVEPCQPGLYNLRFAADKAFMDKLERAAEVSGVGPAGRDMARVFERALDAFLEKHDPRNRQERREKRAIRKAQAEAQVEVRVEVGVDPVACTDDGRGAARSRHIPTSVRDRLLIRSGHQCEYRGSDGLRCGERSRLAIDHIQPWSLGGAGEAGNLRVLCVAHNRLYADRCFGAAFMTQKIELARSRAAQSRPSGYSPPRPDEVANPSRVRESAMVYRAGCHRSGHGPLRTRPRGPGQFITRLVTNLRGTVGIGSVEEPKVAQIGDPRRDASPGISTSGFFRQHRHRGGSRPAASAPATRPVRNPPVGRVSGRVSEFAALGGR